MQALSTTKITRPWHWGIVVVFDPSISGAIPDVEPGRPVTGNGNGLVIGVRHAQDNVPNFEPGFDWAEAAVTIRCLVEPPEEDSSRRVTYRGVLSTPGGTISIGDADDQVLIPAHPIATEVIVSVLAGVADDCPDKVRLDLVPTS